MGVYWVGMLVYWANMWAYWALSAVIQWFKTMTTNEYIRNVKANGWPPFDRKLWQRNYYEHIVRSDDELFRIQNYIINNPIVWSRDPLVYVINY
ncbi:MAG TPA: transposase [Bacillota bacterium]|nr:transposase [Bacillota bacterium]